MAKWSLAVGTHTPGAGVADAAGFGTSGFISLTGGSSTQYIKVQEIELGGQAAASSANIHLWARDSTLVGTPTTIATPNSLGPLDASTAALAAPPVGAVANSGTQGQRSSSITTAKLNLSFNAFGGVLRWQAAPDEEWGMIGNATTTGESSLTQFTGSGTGAIGAHIIFEVK